MNITLHNNQYTISLPKLVFGTGNLSDYTKKESYFALLDAFYAVGGRCIDTARYYGHGVAERVIGEWMKSRSIPRNQLIIVTKGGFPELHDMHASRLTYEQVERDLSESLVDLGLDYTDVYLLHRDNPQRPASVFVDILDELIQSGRVRIGGVSNWTGERISEANQYAAQSGKNPISVSQINFSPAHTTPELLADDTLVCMNGTEAAFYRKSGLPLMAYAALAKGYYPKLAAGKPLSPKAQARYDSPTNRKRFTVLQEVMAAYHVPAAAAALAYLTSHPIQTAAVFSGSTPMQVAEAMQADSICLSADEICRLETEA